MVVALRSGRGLKERRNEEKKTEEEKQTEIGEETKQYNSKITKEERTIKMQQKQLVEEGDLRKK